MKSRLKKLIKFGPRKVSPAVNKFCKLILFHLGVYKIIITLFRKRIPILMIHGVLDESLGSFWVPSWQRTSTAQLEATITVLKKYYRFVSMDEVADLLAGKSVTKCPVMALTFDDGYRNVLTDASPALEAENVPAIVYLISVSLDIKKLMWIDRMDYVLQQTNALSVDILLKNRSVTIRLAEWESFVQDFRDFRIEVKCMYEDDLQMNQTLEAEIGRLESLAMASLTSASVEDRVSALLSSADLEGLGSKILFGSHTVSHVRLDHIGPERLEWELAESKKKIEGHTGKNCQHFCFPNGDFNRESVDALLKQGYRTAVTTLEGCNKIGDAELLALRRVPIPYSTQNYEIVHAIAVNLFRSAKVEV
ncbi:MAG: polysaccharide deacetylase family protein [Pseudomonadales bacterium]|nr:polysaccharide deacetylase family protein [Pseudomonadales bacterium]